MMVLYQINSPVVASVVAASNMKDIKIHIRMKHVADEMGYGRYHIPSLLLPIIRYPSYIRISMKYHSQEHCLYFVPPRPDRSGLRLEIR